MSTSRKALALLSLLVLPLACQAGEGEKGIRHLETDDGIERVDARLRAALEARGLTLMQVVDHAANAEGVGLSLPATRTFIFGNPAVGTPMMQCQGSVALDLPQKLLIREVEAGVRLEWNSPHYLAERHGLEGCDLPLDKVADVLEQVATSAASG